MVTTKIDAPLGSRKVRYAPRLEGRQAQALADVERWFIDYPDSYVSWSGGKDSTVCLDLARRVNPGVRVAFFDSGLEFPQTLRYVERLTERWGLNLHTFHAEPSALEVMAANGSWEHGAYKTDQDLLHEACITRPVARARVALSPHCIYGLRADESTTRRMLLSKTQGHVTNRDRAGRIFSHTLAPIWRWSHDEVHAYLGTHGIPLNPIYPALFRLGVPERRARVGMLVDGWALDQGRWALARAIAPDLCRVVETHLPALADYR